MEPKFTRSVRCLAMLFGLLTVSRLGASDFYVSPEGSGNNAGTLANPWDLQTALSQPSAVRPGDTIWLRGGTYRGTYRSRLSGTAQDPVLVRQYPDERAIIDGGDSGGNAILVVSGSYTWYWGFEVMSSDGNRVSSQSVSWPTDIGRGEAIQIEQTPGSGTGDKFINLIVHDARQGFSFWKEAVDAEISGCLIYNNGWVAPDRGHGHGIYVQNESGTKRIVDNIIFNNFGYGIHAYGSTTAHLDNLHIEGNAAFDNGSPGGQLTPEILVGGEGPASGLHVIGNTTYVSPFENTTVRFGSSAASADAVVQGNRFVGFSIIENWSGLNVSGNTFIGSTTVTQLQTSLTLPSSSYSWNDNSYVSQELQWQPFNLLTPAGSLGLSFPQWQSATGSDSISRYSKAAPSGVEVFVRPNRYEQGRSNIVVYNWDHAATVSVDVSGSLAVGASYEVRNALDFRGAPVARGIYDGKPISLPLAGLQAVAPVGQPAASSPAPEFGAFVLLSSSSALPATPERPGPNVSERGRGRTGLKAFRRD